MTSCVLCARVRGRVSLHVQLRRDATCRQQTNVCSPINHETLGNNYTSTCQDEGRCPPTSEFRNYRRTSSIQRHTEHAQIYTRHCRASSCVSLSLNEDDFFVVGGTSALPLPTLESEQQLLDELRGLARHFTSLLSRSGTPHVRLCVALAAACRAFPREPMPSLTWHYALACSFVIRQFLSLWIATSSCSSVALRLTSTVRCSACFAATHIAS